MREPIDVAASDPAEVRELPGRWPKFRTYYGFSPAPVTLRLGADHVIFFTPDSFQHALLIASRVCAAGGAEAVAADAQTPGLADAYRRAYGSFGAAYELEGWYAPFGGGRRRVMARLCPTQAECLKANPPLPEDYAAPTVEDAVRARDRAAKAPASLAPAPSRGRKKAAVGQGSLFGN